MLSVWTWCGTTAAQTYPSSSGKSDNFTLSGSVVNSVTGEPIGHALVRVGGNTQRTAFSDGEGHFQFEGMPAGMFSVTAQKPGYFSEQELGRGLGLNAPVTLGPSADSVVVKLSPHSVISGRVVDATGQPIEHVPVRLTAKALREGRKHWEARGQQQTDEDGRYRFGDLMPGTYYIAAGPGRDVMMRILRGTESPKIGLSQHVLSGRTRPGVSCAHSACRRPTCRSRILHDRRPSIPRLRHSYGIPSAAGRGFSVLEPVGR